MTHHVPFGGRRRSRSLSRMRAARDLHYKRGMEKPGESATTDASVDAMSALGVLPRRVEILAFIGSSDRGRSAGELMDELGLSRSGLTQHIRPLVAAGLLTPVPDPQDSERRSGKLLWKVDRAAVEEFLTALRRTLGHEI